MTTSQNAAPTVLAETRGTIRILTMNRPEKLNAANLDLQQRLLGELQAAARAPELRALILTGAGRAFSAGGDRDILRRMAEGGGRSEDQDVLGQIHVDTMHCMLGLEIPAIAAVPGPALGYAAGLVAMCDIVVMGENGYLGDPHVRYGMQATTACQVVWPWRCSDALARELLMSGRPIHAAEALATGLANRVCPAGEELTTALALAQVYTDLPPEGVAATKRAFNRPLLRALDALLAGD